MGKPASRLGRGLNSLIPPAAADASGRQQMRHVADPGQIRHVPVVSITPNPRQPRSTFDDESLSELATSIRAHGLLQPIIVRCTGDQQFQIVAGERRWRAARLAGMNSVPAIVRELSDSQSFEFALIENLQREDLAPLERAAAYQHYIETFGGTIEDLAARLSESRANISNYMRLLKLGPEICYMLGAGQLGMGQARAIAGITDPQRQLALARIAVRRNLSVRQVEELARTAGEDAVTSAASEAEVASESRRRHLDAVEVALSKATGLRVRVVSGRRKNSGRVVIHYTNLDEFDRLADRLGGGSQID